MHHESDPFTSSPTRQPSTPPIFLRDFAYPNSSRVILTHRMRMAIHRNIAQSLARDFAELLSGPMIQIFVGKERKEWSLHQNLLCQHSSYFETELLGHEVPKKQREDGSNKLDLPEDDPRGFALFVKWLYQGQLDDVSELNNNDKYEYAVACHKLYLLSSKFSMPHLSNIAMDAYRENLHAAHLVPDPLEINEIYRTSPPGSPFRKLMTKIAARQIMDPEVDKDAESYRPAFESNSDFAVEMVNAIRYMSGGMLFDNPTDGEQCEWHDHSDGSDCSGRKMKGMGKASEPYMNGASGSNSRRIVSPTMTRVRQTPLAELPVDKRTPRKLHLPPQHPAARPGAQQTSTTRGKGRVVSTPLQNATGVSPTKPVAGRPRPVLGKRATSHTNGGNPRITPPRKTASASSSPTKSTDKAEQEGDAMPQPPQNSPVAANGTPRKVVNTANTLRKISPAQPNARRAVSGPAQMNGNTTYSETASSALASKTVAPKQTAKSSPQSHVNGIVQRINGVDGSNSSTSASRKRESDSTAHDGFSVHRAGAPSEADTVATKSVAETTSSEDLSDRKQPVKVKRKMPG